jgi:hypothetical protein
LGFFKENEKQYRGAKGVDGRGYKGTKNRRRSCGKNVVCQIPGERVLGGFVLRRRVSQEPVRTVQGFTAQFRIERKQFSSEENKQGKANKR